MSHDHHHGHHDHSDMATAVNNTSSVMNMNHDHHGSHAGHDMGSGPVNAAAGGHQSHNMMMHMYFHGGTDTTILFEFWQTSEIGGLVASMLVIFLLAFVYEALKFYREHLYRHSFQTVQVDTVSVPVENGGAMKETHKTVQIATSTCNNPYAPEVTPIFISQNTCGCPSVPDSDEKLETVANNNDTEAGDCPDKCSISAPKLTSSKTVHYKVKMLSWMHVWQTCLHVLQVVLSYFLMLIFMTYNVWLCLAVAVGAGSGYFFFGWKKSLVVDITEHCH